MSIGSCSGGVVWRDFRHRELRTPLGAHAQANMEACYQASIKQSTSATSEVPCVPAADGGNPPRDVAIVSWFVGHTLPRFDEYLAPSQFWPDEWLDPELRRDDPTSWKIR